MSRDGIEKMLAEIIRQADYDIFKALFVPECVENPEAAKECIDRMVGVVQKHLRA